MAAQNPFSTNDYRILLTTLGRMNGNLIDSSNSRFFDPVNESFASNFYKNTKPLYEQKVIERDEYLGVVLNVPAGQDYIYVDVPKESIEGIVHADQYAGLEFDPNNNLEHKKFYYASETVQKLEIPSIGAVVRVKLAPNYFNQGYNNPADNKYLGLYKGQINLLPAAQASARAAEALKMSKEQLRDSLFKRKPSSVQQSDIGRLPFSGQFLITSFPSPRIRPNFGTLQQHYALDIGMPEGTPVLATTEQQIIIPNPDVDGFGNYAIGRTPKYDHYYGHLSKIDVKSGTVVPAGTQIGLSGKTGNITAAHLHYEIRVANGSSKLNPLFLLKGQITVDAEVKERFGLETNTFTLPFDLAATSFDPVSVDASEEIASIPQADQNRSSLSNQGVSNSPPRNYPRLTLQSIQVDPLYGGKENFKRGSSSIKVREDIVSDIKQIKDILNNYNIPFSCQSMDINLNVNNNISLLARVGLEINLNINSALTDITLDDYLVAPDYSKPLGLNYELIVYGRVRRNINNIDIEYKPENKVFDVYDLSSGKPKIVKIRESVINITKIFQDYGFVQGKPRQEFFNSGNKEKSSWYVFQKPTYIKNGYSYKELLSTVYDINSKELIWSLSDIYWNGDRFI